MAQFYMTLYTVQANPVVPNIIVALGLLAFVASMLEVLLDLHFPPHRPQNH